MHAHQDSHPLSPDERNSYNDQEFDSIATRATVPFMSRPLKIKANTLKHNAMEQ
jgi:hypothetical protein